MVQKIGSNFNNLITNIYQDACWKYHFVQSEQQLFYDLCSDHFLYQHVTDYTRARGSDSPSLLDLIFTENELEIVKLSFLSPIGASDHSVLTFDFVLEDGFLPEVVNSSFKFTLYW